KPTFAFPVNQSPVVGDFNGDGILDIAVATQDRRVAVLLGNGNGTFRNPIFYSVDSPIDEIVVGDFNGDGRLDLATANGGGIAPPYPAAEINIFYGNGDGTFQAPVPYSYGAADHWQIPISLAVGDFNGDGLQDLVLTANGLPVTVMLNNGNGTFTNAQGPAVSGAGPVVGDFNGDGKLDVAYMSAYISNQINEVYSVILYGNGTGTFQAPVFLGLEASGFGAGQGGMAAGADLNHSGLPSIVTVRHS